MAPYLVYQGTLRQYSLTLGTGQVNGSANVTSYVDWQTLPVSKVLTGQYFVVDIDNNYGDGSCTGIRRIQFGI